MMQTRRIRHRLDRAERHLLDETPRPRPDARMKSPVGVSAPWLIVVKRATATRAQ
jgi:hypothetical protein